VKTDQNDARNNIIFRNVRNVISSIYLLLLLVFKLGIAFSNGYLGPWNFKQAHTRKVREISQRYSRCGFRLNWASQRSYSIGKKDFHYSVTIDQNFIFSL